MFIEFQVGNFRSFRDIETFSMQAAPKRSNDGGLEEGNVFETNGLRMLKTKAIYGSNASGKSNLAKALSAFVAMVSSSVSIEGIAQQIWCDRFQLLTNWDDQPVFFQYIFLIENVIYRYGFQIIEEAVIYEWLFGIEGGKTEVEYFIRNKEGLKINEAVFLGSDIYVHLAIGGDNELFRKDSLFLTGASLNGNKFANKLRGFIKNLHGVDGVNDALALSTAHHELDKGNLVDRKILIDFIKATDTGIEDVRFSKLSEIELGKHFTQKTKEKLSEVENNKLLLSYHTKFDEDGNAVEKIDAPFYKWESEGTKKILAVGGLILKSLREGIPMIIDEFDARFHPNLTLKIVQLYHSKDTNPKNAQLIFITHDSGLLRRGNLRRDQICIVNKDKYGISTLQTLIEYKGVRKDASYEKEYLNGSYSGIPFLNEIDLVIIDNISQ